MFVQCCSQPWFPCEHPSTPLGGEDKEEGGGKEGCGEVNVHVHFPRVPGHCPSISDAHIHVHVQVQYIGCTSIDPIEGRRHQLSSPDSQGQNIVSSSFRMHPIIALF